VKIIAFQLSLFCKKLSLFKDCPLYNKQKNTWVLGNTIFIYRVYVLEINLVFPSTHVLFSIYFLVTYTALMQIAPCQQVLSTHSGSLRVCKSLNYLIAFLISMPQ
jgi:hypothetical protein